jgi:regulatory protein
VPDEGGYTSARRAPRGRARGGRAYGRGPAEQDEPAEPAAGEGRDPAARAREICLRLLTFAPRTRAELAGALHARGIPSAVADEVLGRFADVGLIDDAVFARAWVESRHYSRGLAGRALSLELKRRGVDDEDIREAVAELGPDAEAATAKRLVEQKLASTAGLPPEVRTRRLAGMLARKGYPAGLAFRVIREAIEAEGATAALDQALEALQEEPSFDDPDSYEE